MKNNFSNFSILLLSIFSFIISTKLFWNISLYVDKYNTSPSIVLGNSFWNYSYWFMILFNFLIIVLSAYKFFKNLSRKTN